ncbi:hypothetical protein ENVG_00001 [Emiliania huxleyi virus 84]|nr:hypothetical protein ENVG_00001 [Emiliania huxleyi virus 84]
MIAVYCHCSSIQFQCLNSPQLHLLNCLSYCHHNMYRNIFFYWISLLLHSTVHLDLQTELSYYRG